MAIITQSIGSAVGRDFATIEAWFTAIPTDVVASGNSYVGECYNDSEFTTSSGIALSGKTTSATNNITLKAAAGHSWRDHASVQTNAYRYNPANGVSVRKTGAGGSVFSGTQANVNIIGLQIKHGNGGTDGRPVGVDSTTVVFDACVIETHTGGWYRAYSGGCTFRNCLYTVLYTATFNCNSGTKFENCTIVSPVANGTCFTIPSGTTTVKNTAVFGFSAFASAAFTGNNNASDVTIGSGTNNLPSLVYADQFENITAGAMDFRTKSASALKNAGAVLATTATSANKQDRSQSGVAYDIGSWEVVEAPPAAATNPDAPTNVVAVAGPSRAVVSFTPPAFNGNSVLASYTVESNSGVTQSGSSSPITVLGLNNNQDYVFTVKATNAAGFTSVASTPSASVVPAATAPSAPTIASVIPGNMSVTVTLTPGADNDDPTTAFTVTASPSGVTATSTTPTVVVAGLVNGVAQTFTATQTNGIGTSPPSAASAAVTPADNGDSVQQIGNLTVVTVGIGAGRTYATPKAFWDAAKTKDLVALNQRFVGIVFDNFALDNMVCTTGNADASRYAIMQPAPTLGVNDYHPAGTAYNYGTQGIELTIGAGKRITVSNGAKITGFRITITNTDGLYTDDGQGGAGPVPEIYGNRIKDNAAGGIAFSAYLEPLFYNNLVLRDAAVGGKMINSAWAPTMWGNTFVLLAGGTASTVMDTTYGKLFHDNVCYGFAEVFNGNGGTKENNYSNIQPTTVTTGVVVDTVSAFFVDPANDFRPGLALIGKGSDRLISQPDAFGRNRGLDPDLGAYQGTAATPLPQGVVTVQEMDGATFRLAFTTTNAPTSGKITLSPGNPANGAVSVGPLDLVLTANAGSIEIDDMLPGNYLITATLTNAGGTSVIAGTTAFEVMGVGNLVYDSGDVGTGTDPAPTISITTADTAIMAGKRATISGAVNLNGDANGTIDVFLDPQPAGTPQALGAANVASGTWTKQSDLAPGLYKLRAVATAAGQTAQASTGNVRVLNLVGNFNLPAA